MNTDLEGKVIGQDDAIKKVVKAIKRNRAGLKDPNKPIGSFIFLAQPALEKRNWPRCFPNSCSIQREALIE